MTRMGTEVGHWRGMLRMVSRTILMQRGSGAADAPMEEQVGMGKLTTPMRARSACITLLLPLLLGA